jgi:hypothetical protein
MVSISLDRLLDTLHYKTHESSLSFALLCSMSSSVFNDGVSGAAAYALIYPTENIM